MPIRDVRTTLLRMPWVDPPRFSPSYDRPRELFVLEIEEADGTIGMGYLQPLAGGLATIDACVKELVRPKLIGRGAHEIEAIWRDLWAGTYWIGRMGVALFALSAVDIALWDLAGKRAGLPLWKLWGGCDRPVAAYGSGCWRGLGGDGMVEKAKRFVDQGFTAIKMQAGHLHPWRQDVRHVRQMREALGPDVGIMIDVNMGWTADQAIQAGRRFEEFDVYWLEEPVVAEDFEGYLRVAEALDLRVVGGESHFTRWDLRPFWGHSKVPILQPDPMRGGLTELRKIAAVADTWNITIAPHLFPELMVHLMASIPNGLMLEYMDFLDDVWVDPVLPENGHIRPPDRPGHGLAIRPDLLSAYRVAE